MIALIVAGTVGVLYLIGKAFGFDLFGITSDEDPGEKDNSDDMREKAPPNYLTPRFNH